MRTSRGSGAPRTNEGVVDEYGQVFGESGFVIAAVANRAADHLLETWPESSTVTVPEGAP